MPLITYDFLSSSDYNFDSDKIELVDGGGVRLKLKPADGQIFSEDFNTDTDFTYDSSLAEFASGVLRQKNRTPTNSILAAKYTSTADLNWRNDGGSLTASLTGSPTVTGGKLVCSGAQGAKYSGTSTAIETYKFIYTPAYSGAPASNINLVSFKDAANNDRFALSHSNAGDNFRITVNDSSGVGIVGTSVIGGSSVGLVSGTDYEFEVVVDSTAGTVRLFIDGTLHGTLSPGAWARGGSSGTFDVGASAAIYTNANASFDNFILYDNAQHTSGYTAGYTLVNTLYGETIATLPTFSHVGVGSIISLDSLSVTETDNPRYTLALDGGAQQYWTGSAWAAADGTYSQANSVADFNANIASLAGQNGAITVTMKVVFTETNTRGSVDDLTLDHTGHEGYYTDNPTVTPTTKFNTDELVDLIEDADFETGTALDDWVSYVLNVDGTNYWHNGVEWIESDGTFAESNTEGEINYNIDKLITDTRRGQICPIIFLHSGDGQTRPNLTSSTFDFSFFGGEDSALDTCTVYGYTKSIDGSVASGVTVSATIPHSVEIAGKLIGTGTITATSDTTGYWELALPRRSGGVFVYTLTFSGTNISYTDTVRVPDQSTASYEDI